MWLVQRIRAMMPQDSLQLALTTGFGFSVLAGIFSGVVYIISVGYNKKKRIERPDTPWHCTFCGRQFHSIGGVLEHEEVVTCMKCARTFCKEKCAKRSKPRVAYSPTTAAKFADTSDDDTSRRSSYSATERWICKKCQPDSWISGIVRLLQFNDTKEWYTKKMTSKQAQINAELLAMQTKEREQVRDFIERLVESLLGGELDTVSVKKIYNDERYLPIAGESPCGAHTSLKRLIQRFIREASELPELRKIDERQVNDAAIEDDTDDRTYEDLLSSAIINKVVQSYQDKTPSVAGSSSSKSKQSTSDKEFFLGERNLDTPSKLDDTSSLSSLDEYINNNGSTKYLDQMNFAIQQSIKEVSSSDDEDVNYDIDEIDSSTARNNDLQNWYLRKRNFGSGTNSPVPVPMLVPNPNTAENAKVLIGDRDIDDTSDLSDAASDYEDAAEPSSLNAVLINSKHLIGGRNPLISMVAKAESIIDDEEPEVVEPENTTNVQVHQEDQDNLELNEEESEFFDEADKASDIIETCNEAFIREPPEDDLGACGDVEDQLISLESNTEKYSEYTEKYATLPRKIPMPTPRQSKLSDIDFSKTSLLIEDSKTDNGDSGVTSDEDDKQKTFKGSSYSEREKDKWNHAVELPNNPYSKSNLESRLSNRSNSSSISSLNSTEHLPDDGESSEVKDPEPIHTIESNITESNTDDFPSLPETPNSEMRKSLFDVLNDDRKGHQHRYGRDYFAKAAARPQGALKKNWLDDEDNLRQDGGDIADDEERKVDIVDEPIVPQELVFRAVPALIQLDEAETTETQQPVEQVVEDHFDEMSSVELSTPTKRLQPWDLSSDSDYSIERTYNVNSGKIIKKLGDVEYELPISEVPSAEGLKYTKLDENQNADMNLSPKPKLSEFERKRSFFLKSLTIEDEGEETVEDVTPPTVNHFKLVHDIANENDEAYKTEVIQPPAEYRNENVQSIEYESEEKSYDFSIESTYEDEQRQKEQTKNVQNDELIEESLNRGIIEPDTSSIVPKNEIIEESLNSGIKEVPTETQPIKKEEDILVEESLNRGIIEPPAPIVPKNKILEEILHNKVKEVPPKEEYNVEESDNNNLIDITEVDKPLTSQNLNKIDRQLPQDLLDQQNGNILNEEETNLVPEPDIEQLQEKKLVKNILGVFSKSFPNLTTATPKTIRQPVDSGDMLSLSSDFVANSIEIEEASPKQEEESVQYLKKRFENDSDTRKDVEVNSSLTARSMPKQMRKQLSQAPPTSTENTRRQSVASQTSNEQEDTIDGVHKEEITQEPEIVSFPKARSRIAFFENMKQK